MVFHTQNLQYKTNTIIRFSVLLAFSFVIAHFFSLFFLLFFANKPLALTPQSVNILITKTRKSSRQSLIIQTVPEQLVSEGQVDLGACCKCHLFLNQFSPSLNKREVLGKKYRTRNFSPWQNAGEGTLCCSHINRTFRFHQDILSTELWLKIMLWDRQKTGPRQQESKCTQ